jgi:hypothetical protein
MTAKHLFGVVATVASFAVFVGMCMAVDTCTHLTDTCPGWGATNPPVQGYCCVSDYSTTKPCGTSTKSVTVHETAYCGHLKGIVNGECTGTDGDGCGQKAGKIGCISTNCPAG